MSESAQTPKASNSSSNVGRMIALYKEPMKFPKLAQQGFDHAYQRSSRSFLTNLYKVEEMREEYLQR